MTCLQGSTVTRGNAYRVFVAVFLLAVGPFAFFNLSKTKYLQVVIIIIILNFSKTMYLKQDRPEVNFYLEYKYYARTHIFAK